jgi:AraC-like DNA-binding protein
MDSNYMPWPAENEDLIKISVFNGSTPVNSHMHDYIEIVFFAKGSSLHQYHNNEIMLIPGDVFIVVPHETHSYEINSQTVIYNCLFYPEALGADWNQLKEISGVNNLLMVEPFYRIEQKKQEVLHLNPAESSYIEVVLKKMIDEQENKNSGFQLVQKANLILLISIMGRAWEKQFKDSEYYFNEKRNILAEALSYIEENFSAELKVRQLAPKAYMSPDYFRKVFKEITGLSPLDYINKVRISKSVMLLEESALPIARIAEMVGISDVNYFSRLFRAKLGYSPSEHRKKNEKC